MTRVNNSSIPGDSFNWPEFSSDSERIKQYSKRFKDCSISEAFEHVYGVKLKGSEKIEETPTTHKVGDILSLHIASISKNCVAFNENNLKTNVLSNTNLYRFEKFKHFLPTDAIKVKVTDVKKDRVTVDPLTPIFDDWIQPILKDVKSQRVIGAPKSIKVKNLKLTAGGFMGQAVIPSLSDFVGEEYTVEAFIPGSQIVLNITDDFEQFVGKDVDAFVSNYIPKPGAIGSMSLICSAKELIKFEGELMVIDLFKKWCDDGDEWKKETEKKYMGEVTGVINSAKKCGVFVEIPELKTTGMVNVKPDELVNYHPHDDIEVRLVNFDENLFYNNITEQLEHGEPYTISKEGDVEILRRCNVKPVFEIA